MSNANEIKNQIKKETFVFKRGWVHKDVED